MKKHHSVTNIPVTFFFTTVCSPSSTFECGGAGITALVVHWLDEGPLVGLGEVALGCVLSVVAVITSHGIDQPVVNCCTHVTPGKMFNFYFYPFFLILNFLTL